jgi:hypothetical protein
MGEIHRDNTNDWHKEKQVLKNITFSKPFEETKGKSLNGKIHQNHPLS